MFEEVPQAHDGSTSFEVWVYYYSAMDSPPDDITATNATVTTVAAVGNSKHVVRIVIMPTSSSSVRVTVPGIGSRTAQGPVGDARLKDIWVPKDVLQGEAEERVSLLTPGGNKFNPDIREYRVEGSIVVSMEPYDSSSTIQVFGKPGTFAVSSLSGGGKNVTVSFDGDDTDRDRRLTVQVTSENGNHTRNYYLQFAGGPRACNGELISPNVPEYFTELDTLTVTATGGSVVSGPGPLAHYLRGYTVYVTNSTTRVRVRATGDLYPWGRYEASDHVSVWGVAGFGTGTQTLTPED